MNYAELKTAFAAYANNTQAVPSLPILLPMAEQRIYRGEQNTPALRISAMLKSGNSFTLPDDFLEMQRVSSSNVQMRFIPYSQMLDFQGASGQPYGYSINGLTLALGPVASSVDYTYYAKFATPSADTDTNWLLTNAPSIYLESLLVEWGKRTRDDTLLAREAGNYASSLSALMSQDKAAQISGGTLRMNGPHRVRSGRGGGGSTGADPSFDAADYFNNQLN